MQEVLFNLSKHQYEKGYQQALNVIFLVLSIIAILFIQFTGFSPYLLSAVQFSLIMFPSVLLNIAFLLSGLNRQLTIISKINFKTLKWIFIAITGLYGLMYVLILIKGVFQKDSSDTYMLKQMDYGAAILSQLVF